MNSRDTLDQRWFELRDSLIDWGRDYIEEFLGYEYPYGEDVGMVETRLDAAFRDMDDETVEDFYRRFCVEECP